MAEYIEREAFLDAIERGKKYQQDADDIAEMLQNFPAADVRPVVKATWIVKELQALFPGMDEHPVFACSECDYQIYDLFDRLKERHHYCPNCGADMREKS